MIIMYKNIDVITSEIKTSTKYIDLRNHVLNTLLYSFLLACAAEVA